MPIKLIFYGIPAAVAQLKVKNTAADYIGGGGCYGCYAVIF
jgi:hypothetical protein